MKSYLLSRVMLMMTFILGSSAIMLQAQVSHNVTVANNTFAPQTLEINVGDTVVWTNIQGDHNVNGTQGTYPDNPVSFGNDVGSGWTYNFVFNEPGTYDYQCDPHVSMGMTGKVIVKEEDSGINQISVTLSLTGMTPHDGQMLIVYLVNTDDDSYADTITIDEITEADFDVESEVDSGVSYRIDFFADHNGNGTYDAPPTDHAWRIDLGVVNADTVVTFAHNTDFTNIFETPTGISHQTYTDLILFPNPAGEFVRISGKDLPQGNLDVQIMNVTGQIMRSTTISDDNKLISLKGLSNGAYFMLVKANGFTARGKFIKAY